MQTKWASTDSNTVTYSISMHTMECIFPHKSSTLINMSKDNTALGCKESTTAMTTVWSLILYNLDQHGIAVMNQEVLQRSSGGVPVEMKFFHLVFGDVFQ